VKLADLLLEKLADEDDFPDFVCPSCGGAFFSRNGQSYECDTITESLQCRWKGPESDCLVPSRASLAKEILALRHVISKTIPYVSGATSVTSGRDFRGAAEALLAEMRDLIGRRS